MLQDTHPQEFVNVIDTREDVLARALYIRPLGRWSGYEDLAALAKAQQLNIVVIVRGAPTWVHPGGNPVARGVVVAAQFQFGVAAAVDAPVHYIFYNGKDHYSALILVHTTLPNSSGSM